MKIGLYGGSFDPIHNGHLLPVRRAREVLGLDRVLYLPTARPPHKRRRMAPAETRYAMVEMALLHEPGAFASPFEMRQRETAYTVHTLEHFRDTFPSARLFLIVGADSFVALPTWRDWRRLLELAELAVLTRPERPGGPSRLDDPDLAPELRQALDSGRAHPVHNEPVTISSTEIRRRLASGVLDVAPWLPPLVLDYIRKYDLYREPQETSTSL